MQVQATSTLPSAPEAVSAHVLMDVYNHEELIIKKTLKRKKREHTFAMSLVIRVHKNAPAPLSNNIGSVCSHFINESLVVPKDMDRGCGSCILRTILTIGKDAKTFDSLRRFLIATLGAHVHAHCERPQRTINAMYASGGFLDS